MKLKSFMAALVAVVLGACSGENVQNQYVRTVKTVKPVQASQCHTRQLAGTVNRAKEINIGFKTAGQIEKIYVKEGDYVRKGALLAALDDTDYVVGAEGLRAQAAQLNAELDRSEKLYHRKSMSLNDYEKIKTACAQIQSQLKGVENKIAYTRLYAPVSGYIREVNFYPAEMVDAGTPVFNLMDDSAMDIVVDVPATLYRSIGEISQARTFAPETNKEIALKIISVVPKADGNQLFRMKLAPVSGGDSAGLTPGTNINVELTMDSGAPSADISLIPAHAVVHRNDTTFVWVVANDSTLLKRPVTLGEIDRSGMVSISGGLSGDENIVSSGVNMLRENEKVKILDNPSPTNVGGLL